MKLYLTPEEDIDYYSITKAVELDAWLVVPKCVNIDIVEGVACDYGFGDSLKVCHWDKVPRNEPVVAVYADYILQEMLGGNCKAMFVES